MDRRLPIGLAAILVAAGALLVWRYAPSSQSSVPALAAIAPIEVTTSESTYHNATYGFSLRYPPTFMYQEFNEQGGSMTVTFETATDTTGFEIFVTPYDEQKISPQRFRMDEPSGVIRTPVTVLIGGIPAIAFFGYNDLMGDTREVWFIHNGYLYEVTTYRDLDTQLAGIMSTWRFDYMR